MPAAVALAALLVSVVALAVSEAVQLEVIKTLAIAIAAASAIASAWISASTRREQLRVRDELRRRRHEVRNPPYEHVVVVDHPPTEPLGANRRATDPHHEEAP